MDERLSNALNALAGDDGRLRSEYHMDWPEAIEQAVHRLRLQQACAVSPPIVAIVGGASSGKSTVFNNLLGGREASRITARGHATKGPILAAHVQHQDLIRSLLANGYLLPGLRPTFIEMDTHVEGDPDSVAVLFHPVDALQGVLLLDTPDFTSEAARQEGDILLSLLPWFDRILIVIDRERWFDRQSISLIRTHSMRYGQQRMVLFNSTQEGELGDEDLIALHEQARRLSAEHMQVLEFRRGRGLREFPPKTFDDVHRFLSAPVPDRTKALFRVAADASRTVLSHNDERRARLAELGVALRRAVERTTPTRQRCMTALMTPAEREHLEIVSRVVRMRETKAWFAAQKRRFGEAMRGVPIVASIVGPVAGGSGDDIAESSPETDRNTIASAYFESVVKKQMHEIGRVERVSPFWDDVRIRTGLSPSQRTFEWTEAARSRLQRDVQLFEAALCEWSDRVEAECQGISPNIRGAVTVGVLGIAIVLVAVPGSVSLLTLAVAKGALGAALGKLALVSGVGAAFGRHIGRLVNVVQEKLIGSSEFEAVQDAADSLRDGLHSAGQRQADAAVREARTLVIGGDDPLLQALECLSESSEVSS